MDAIDKTGVRVRWLIAGAFSANPTGKRFSVTGAELPNALESAKLNAKVTVTDRLGEGATRTFDVAFGSFKTFQVNEIVAAIPTLKELQSLAAGLASAERRDAEALAMGLALALEPLPGQVAAVVARALPATAASEPRAEVAAGLAVQLAEALAPLRDALRAPVPRRTPAAGRTP